MSNVGINVIEVDGNAPPTIAGAATSVAAFAGITTRGVPNRPVSVTTPADFEARFGGFRSDGYLAYALNGFFTNGGRQAYVTRIVAAGALPSSLSLNGGQATPAPVLQVRAGYRGRLDPGTWGDALRIDVAIDPLATTTLHAPTVASATSAQLESVNGIRIGSVLRFVDGATVVARKVTSVDPAAKTVGWTDPIVPVLAQATTRLKSFEFRLTVRQQPPAGGDSVLLEDWRNLSMETDVPNYAPVIVNDPFTGSRSIVLTDLGSAAALTERVPARGANFALGGGAEPAPVATDFIGNAAAKSGLSAFDTSDVQLVAVPDVHTLDAGGRISVVHAVLDYCAARGDCMYVGAAPDRAGAVGTVKRSLADYTQLESDYLAAVQTYAGLFHGAKVYGALYAPWILVNDPIAPGAAAVRFVPPEGAAMGVYARTEQERGIAKAPAGDSAFVRGALGISATFTDAQHTSLVRSGFVNGIRSSPATGITIAASRTLSSDTRWWFVNVRLLFNFVKSSLRDGLRFVRQEPHTEQLRRMVRLNVVTPFLLGLWRQGAFGSDPPKDVFSVLCDASNNPPDQVDLGYFKIEVYFYPVKPAETILIVVGQQPSGAVASEA